MRQARLLLQANPPDMNTLWFLASLLIRGGNFEDAIAVLEMYIRVKPDNAEAHFQLGMLHEYLFDYAKAIERIETAARLNPSDEQFTRSLGDIRKYLDTIAKGEPYLGPVLMSFQDPYLKRFPRLHSVIRHVFAHCPQDFVNILEMGSWAGGSALLWASALQALRERKGNIYCVDPWREFWDLKTVREETNRQIIAALVAGNQGELPLSGEATAHRRMNDALKSGELLRLFLYNIKAAGFEDIITPLRGSDRQVLPMLRDGIFDFVYVDASHEYEDVKYDVAEAMRLVKDGGFIAGDDLPMQLHECDADEVREHVRHRRELATDSRTGEHYCPGVALAVAEAFGRVGQADGVWAVRKVGDRYEPVPFEDLDEPSAS